MTPIEWVLLGTAILQGILIPAAGWFWKMTRDSVKDKKLRQTIDDAVRGAEELGASGELSGNKRNYVFEVLESRNLIGAGQRTQIELLINAAVQIAGIGASAKVKETETP